MLKRENTAFVLIDVQGKLAEIVHESKEMMKNLQTLIQAMKILEIPIIWVEQYPEGLGPTSKELSDLLTDYQPIRKMTFDACKTEQFVQAVKETGKTQMLVAGIETHICVYQTAYGLKQLGYEVEVVKDGVSSRRVEDKEVGIEKMKSAGILVTCVETAIYELLEVAGTEEFKKILKLVK